MIIKHPMDFGTMKEKIAANEYKSVTEFKVRDFTRFRYFTTSKKLKIFFLSVEVFVTLINAHFFPELSTFVYSVCSKLSVRFY